MNEQSLVYIQFLESVPTFMDYYFFIWVCPPTTRVCQLRIHHMCPRPLAARKDLAIQRMDLLQAASSQSLCGDPTNPLPSPLPTFGEASQLLQADDQSRVVMFIVFVLD